MTAPVENIAEDHRLQEGWLNRLIAAIIDGLITWAISLVFYIPMWLFAHFIPFMWLTSFIWPFMWGLVYVVYSAIMESSSGSTIGKGFMNLHVISISGELSFNKTMTRNISKIHVLFLIIDVLIGIFTEGDPRQRYLDRVAGTTVIARDMRPQPVPYTPAPQPPPQYKPAEGAAIPAPPQKQQPLECASCGGRLIDASDGRKQCIRCGKAY